MSTLRIAGLLLLLALPAFGDVTGVDDAEALIDQGRVAIRSNQWQSAEGIFRTAIDRYPTNATAYGGLGATLLRRREYEEAIGAYQKAISLDPKYTNAWLGLSDTCFRAGKYRTVIETFQRFDALSMTDARMSSLLGSAYLKLDRYADAEEAERQAIMLDPTNSLHHGELGYALERQHRDDLAIKSYRDSLSLNPRQTNIWLNIGSCYENLGEYARAIESYHQYLALNTRNAHAYYLLARSLERLGRRREAELNCRRALALNRTNDLYWSSLGYYLERLSRYDDAIDVLRKATRLNPQNAYAQLQLGVCDYYRGDYTNALGSLQQCVTLETNDVAYAWLGDTYNRLGLRTNAVAAFQRCLQVNPDNYDANESYALLLLRMGRYDEAVPPLEKLRSLNRYNRFARHLLFYCYLIKGDYSRAYRLQPALSTVIGSLSLMAYLAGLGSLLYYGWRLAPRSMPGVGFSLSWLALYFEGQVAILVCLAVASLLGIHLNLLAGMSLGTVPIAFAAWWIFARQPWGEPFRWPPKFGSAKILGLALLFYILSMAVSAGYAEVVQWITHKPMSGQNSLPFLLHAITAHPVSAVIMAVVMAPVAEEIMFRGLIYGALEKRMRAVWAIVLSAAIFAAVHLQPVHFVPLFCLGMLLGWARWKTNSLGLSTLIHAVNNGFALLVLKFLHHDL